MSLAQVVGKPVGGIIKVIFLYDNIRQLVKGILEPRGTLGICGA